MKPWEKTSHHTPHLKWIPRAESSHFSPDTGSIVNYKLISLLFFSFITCVCIPSQYTLFLQKWYVILFIFYTVINLPGMILKSMSFSFMYFLSLINFFIVFPGFWKHDLRYFFISSNICFAYMLSCIFFLLYGCLLKWDILLIEVCSILFSEFLVITLYRFIE